MSDVTSHMTRLCDPNDYTSEYELHPRCKHCRTNIVDALGYELALCEDCRSLAQHMPILTVCDLCPTEEAGIESCNDADALADWEEWCQAAAFGTDPLMTYPEELWAVGRCSECFASNKLRTWIAERTPA